MEEVYISQRLLSHRLPAGLEEHGLLDLFSSPSESLVELACTTDVGDADGDEADPLLHPGDGS